MGDVQSWRSVKGGSDRKSLGTTSNPVMNRSPWIKGFLRTAAATLVYAAVHSFFASRTAKRLAAKLAGQRNVNALYRPFYLVQSAITIAPLIAYIRRQPTRVLYENTGLAALPFRAIQAGGICWATTAAYEVGLSEILGIRPAGCLFAGAAEIAPEPAAQGPALLNGHMKARGPFCITRHPLNVAPLPIIWFFPRMTTNLLAFNLVSTGYLVLGSALEEKRLLERYGSAYAEYRLSGVPFYLPRIVPSEDLPCRL